MNAPQRSADPRPAQDGAQAGQAPGPSPSFNPIADHYSVKRFEFLHRRPAVDANIALVFATLRKGLVDFVPGRVPTLGELLWSGIRTVYEIDMALHQTQIRIELPSADEAFAFQAEIDVQWRVRDARRVVIDGIKDVREALAPSASARLREITRRYAIEAAANAEDAANSELRGAPVGVEFGLEVTAFVRLTMDAPTKEHAANLRGVQRYRQIITAGDTDQFALLLSQNPSDSGAVLRALSEERDSNRRLTADFVNKLIESGAIERWEIDEQVRTALDWLKESTDRVIRPDESQPLVTGAATVLQVPPGADGSGNGSGTTRTDYDGG